MTTTTTDLYPDVPLPNGAIRVHEWYDTDTPNAARYFVGSQWVIEHGDDLDKDITVCIDGVQFAGGSISRVITTALGDIEAFDPLHD